MTGKQRLSLRAMAQIAMMAVIISICSWITVPFTVPFTMQTFAVFAALLICDCFNDG